MFLKHNPWKLLTALAASFVAMVCSSGPSRAASVSIEAPSGPTTEPTVEQRVAKVREEFTDREQHSQHSTESDLTRPEPSDLQAKEEEELLSQYWSNWSNYWNNY